MLKYSFSFSLNSKSLSNLPSKAFNPVMIAETKYKIWVYYYFVQVLYFINYTARVCQFSKLTSLYGSRPLHTNWPIMFTLGSGVISNGISPNTRIFHRYIVTGFQSKLSVRTMIRQLFVLPIFSEKDFILNISLKVLDDLFHLINEWSLD